MLFMTIERFRDNDMLPIYERVRDEGLEETQEVVRPYLDRA